MKALRYLWVIMVMVAAFALPTMAQTEFQSTSTMPGSGSSLSSQVTTVGATSVESTAGSTNNSPARVGSGPRKGFLDPNNPGNQSNESPIGDAALPLTLIALAYTGFAYIRRRKAAHSDAHV